ncbi:MAG: DNA repair protein RecO [Proteobacteria bacterium]|nr:MAG: DNA repair protein RecO [Pseudomonadota bacterium]
MQHSLGYVLRTRPYSDANVIVDLFTQDAGRITCMARPARQRGKVQKGHLQPFRTLQLQWSGRGALPRLDQTDEQLRHRISAAQLVHGMYLNELILRLLPPQHSIISLYRDYHAALQLLVDSQEPMLVLMRFELGLMQSLGYSLSLWKNDGNGEAIGVGERYLYVIGAGIIPYDHQQIQPAGVQVRGDLLVALREPTTMSIVQYQQLRRFLDQFWLQLLSKPFNSRKLLPF